jgi:hypothetical protein
MPNAGTLAVVPALDRAAWDLSPLEALERVLEAGAPWIGESDAPKVALLRESLEELERAKANATIRDRMVIIKEASSLMSELGFDPSARARLGLAEVKAASTLEKLRASQKQ